MSGESETAANVEESTANGEGSTPQTGETRITEDTDPGEGSTAGVTDLETTDKDISQSLAAYEETPTLAESKPPANTADVHEPSKDTQAKKKTLAMVLEAGSFGAPSFDPSPVPVDLDATVVTTPSLLQNPVLADAHIQSANKDNNSNDEPSTFVNHGFIRWEAARKAWLGNRSSADDESHPARSAKPLDVDEIIDIVFLSSSSSHKGGPVRFPQNVALPQMVDILQDLWEAEGLDA